MLLAFPVSSTNSRPSRVAVMPDIGPIVAAFQSDDEFLNHSEKTAIGAFYMRYAFLIKDDSFDSMEVKIQNFNSLLINPRPDIGRYLRENCGHDIRLRFEQERRINNALKKTHECILRNLEGFSASDQKTLSSLYM